MGSEHMPQTKHVAPEELRSEEEVLQKDPQNLFLGPGDQPEPSRPNYIAYVRLEPFLQSEQGHVPLIADMPRRRELFWR